MNQNRSLGIKPVEALIGASVLIALLAIVLSVLLFGARRGLPESCAANIKGLSQGLSMYASDYDGDYPPVVAETFNKNDGGVAQTGDVTHDWIDLVEAKVARPVPSCPLVETPGLLGSARGQSSVAGYAMNAELVKTSMTGTIKAFIGRNVSEVRNAAMTVTVADSRAGVIGLSGPDDEPPTPGLDKLHSVYLAECVPEILKQPIGATRHKGGANYAFADNHVKWLTPDKLSLAGQGDGVHPGFGL